MFLKRATERKEDEKQILFFFLFLKRFLTDYLKFTVFFLSRHSFFFFFFFFERLTAKKKVNQIKINKEIAKVFFLDSTNKLKQINNNNKKKKTTDLRKKIFGNFKAESIIYFTNFLISKILKKRKEKGEKKKQ